MAKITINSITLPNMNVTIKVAGVADYTCNIDTTNLVDVTNAATAQWNLKQYVNQYRKAIDDAEAAAKVVDPALTALIGTQIDLSTITKP